LTLRATTSQTVGPFFQIGFARGCCADLAPVGVAGERIVLEGVVLDGDAAPVPDAILEIWQANAQGKYAHPEDQQNKAVDPGFKGYGRIATDQKGRFCFTTIKPGPVPGPHGVPQAPHLVVSVFMRGLLKRLVTRIYFPDDPRNGDDAVLNLVPPARRNTLIARRVPEASGKLHWNVILQGTRETVFLDC
jgi:protocatechuate 3,4-dioxygenase, alpha subunit